MAGSRPVGAGSREPAASAGTLRGPGRSAAPRRAPSQARQQPCSFSVSAAAGPCAAAACCPCQGTNKGLILCCCGACCPCQGD